MENQAPQARPFGTREGGGFIPPYVRDAVARSIAVIARASARAVETIRSRATAILEKHSEESPERHAQLSKLLEASTTAGSAMDYLAEDPELENAILLLSKDDREVILSELRQHVAESKGE